MVCRWIYDKSVPNGRYFVPDCYGSVHREDFANCYCKRLSKADRLECLEAKVEKLTDAVSALSAKLGVGKSQ